MVHFYHAGWHHTGIRDDSENSADWIYFLPGIMLQLSQWEKLKNYVSDIDEAIEELNG